VEDEEEGEKMRASHPHITDNNKTEFVGQTLPEATSKQFSQIVFLLKKKKAAVK
jgi:hypothetical protein